MVGMFQNFWGERGFVSENEPSMSLRVSRAITRSATFELRDGIWHADGYTQFGLRSKALTKMLMGPGFGSIFPEKAGVACALRDRRSVVGGIMELISATGGIHAGTPPY